MDESLTISQLVYPELKTTCKLSFSSYNFHTWKSKLDFVLVDNRVKYVLTETKPEPSAEGGDAADEKWIADDFTARHIILGTLDDSVHLLYRSHDTAKSLMDAITKTFTRPSMARRICLFRRYIGSRMNEEGSINLHFAEMGSMARQLELEGVKIPEELQAVILMDSLPEAWDSDVGGAIVNIDQQGLDLDTVTEKLKVMGTWKQYFRDRDRERDEEKSNSSMVSGRSRKFKGNCYNCGEYGHRSSDCGR